MENDINIPFGIQVPEPSELAPYLGRGIDLPTFGGKMSVQWDPDARVTSVAGLAHFGTFLANVGLFDRMAEDAPFDYRSNNACAKRDIFGTAVLGVLLGKTRYVHLNELRHDSAAKALLALDEIVSEDTVRRAFRNADEEKFKVRRSRVIRSLFKALSDKPGWKDCGSGWESYEMHVKLNAWSRERRLLFVRRPAEKKVEVVRTKPLKTKVPSEESRAPVPTTPAVVKQPEFEFVKDLTGREWDYCVLVTNDEALDATALSQLYRDRGDCENNFDEYKNQWGWAGFTTKKIKSCRAMARLIAIVANWWNVYCRLADPSAHREAITSRPSFLRIMGRIVESGRRRTIHLTSSHSENAFIRHALDTVAAFFGWMSSNAEQLKPDMRWKVVLAYAFRRLLIPDPALRALVPI